MKTIISPAKKMRMDTDSLPCIGLPRFLEETELLMCCMKKMDYNQLKELWKCNGKIAQLNYERLRHMDLRKSLTPSILAYEGLQYQYMAPGVFEDSQLEYIGEHLRILSGFYGLLRPFDGVTLYRLEMQAKLNVNDSKNLYGFWGDRLAVELAHETDFILNLASKEYSRVIEAHLPPNVHFLTCTFGEKNNNQVIEKGTVCKMARGQMVRFLAENRITNAEDIKKFDDFGYSYSKEHSTSDNFVFLKQK